MPRADATLRHRSFDEETRAMALAFTPAEYSDRIERALRALNAAGLDALIITAPENICYLSGFATPGYHVFQALVVRQRGEPFLVVRNIEEDNVRERAWIRRFHPIDNLDLALPIFAAAMKSEGAANGRIGVEVDGARQAITRLDLLKELMPEAEFVPSLGLADNLRAVKSEREIAYIEKAVAMAENAVVAGAKSLRSAATDSDVAAAVHAELARSGSEFTGSPPYVVGGLASVVTHANHARRPLRKSDPMWLEVAASVERYHGVCGRIGGIDISAEARRMFDASAAALTALIEAMRPGAPAGTVDAAGRAAAERHGAGKYWRNRAAYSLGLSFPPGLGEGHIIDIKPDDPRPLRSGMVFHLIPILKVPGVGMIGCTETVMVTDAGGRRLGKLDFAPLT